jgi:hypothetical protein
MPPPCAGMFLYFSHEYIPNYHITKFLRTLSFGMECVAQRVCSLHTYCHPQIAPISKLIATEQTKVNDVQLNKYIFEKLLILANTNGVLELIRTYTIRI